MRKLFLLLALFVLASSGWSQNTVTQSGLGPPAGACQSFVQRYIDLTNSRSYFCVPPAWVLNGGGSGSLAIGDPVTGGTPGASLFVDASGNLGQEPTKLFWDTVNFWLGIGTNAPASPLHVVDPLGGQTTVARFESLETSSASSIFFDHPDITTGNVAQFSWFSDNSMGVSKQFGALGTVFKDKTSGSSKGVLQFSTLLNGTLTARAHLDENGLLTIGTAEGTPDGSFSVLNGTFAGAIDGCDFVTLSANDDTPSVAACGNVRSNNSMATTVTNLDGAFNGGVVRYLVNDSNTSLAQTGNIVLSTSGTHLFLTGELIVLTCNGTVCTQEGTVASQLITPYTTIGITVDGGGSAITTGVKGYAEVPFACTIDRATLLADQSGSIVIDVWKDTYANYPPTDADTITASAPPTITTATKSQDATLTGWTTTVTAGDIIGFNVDSATTVTRVHLTLRCLRTA